MKEIIIQENEAEVRVKVALLNQKLKQRLVTETLMAYALSLDDEGFHPAKDDEQKVKEENTKQP